MSVQPSLFDLAAPAAPARAVPVNRSVHPAEAPRLQRQCHDILAVLRQRDASNFELAEIARKYTGRLSEIRQAGYVVRIIDRDHTTGRCVYRLEKPAEARA
jgi:hypothetical protein